MTAAQMAYEFQVGFDNITNLSAEGYNEREISTLLTKAQEQLFYSIINPESNKLNSGIESTEKRRIDLIEYIRDASCSVSLNQTGVHKYGVFFDLPNDFFYTLSEDAYSNLQDCKESGRVNIIFDTTTLNLATAQFIVGETVLVGSATYLINSGAGNNFIMTLISGNPVTAGTTMIGATSGAAGNVLSVTPIYSQLLIKVIKHDEFSINWINPFKRPYKELCWRMDYSSLNPNTTAKRHELITDGTYHIVNYSIRYYKKPTPIIVPTRPTFPAFVIDEINVPSGFAGLDCELNTGVHRAIIDIAIRLAVAALEETDSYKIKSIENLKSE